MSAALLTARRVHVQHPLESVPRGLDFTRVLRPDETLVEVNAIDCAPPGPVITQPSANVTHLFNDEGGHVAPGKAALYRLANVAADTEYRITIQVTTSLGAIRVGVVLIQGRLV